MKKSENDIQESILEYLRSQEWPSTSEDVAKGCKLSWNTANLHLVKLQHQGKVKFRRVGGKTSGGLNQNIGRR